MRREAFVWNWTWVCASLAILVLVAACGRNDSAGETSSGGAPAVVATMPAAKFTAVAEQVAPGSAVLTQTTVLTETAGAVDPQTLERGAAIYVNRKCGDCHGAQGEGVADKGSAVAATQLSDQEFDNIMRTGGNGELGPDHLYGPSAISPGGMDALHAWLQSLPAE